MKATISASEPDAERILRHVYTTDTSATYGGADTPWEGNRWVSGTAATAFWDADEQHVRVNVGVASAIMTLKDYIPDDFHDRISR